MDQTEGEPSPAGSSTTGTGTSGLADESSGAAAPLELDDASFVVDDQWPVATEIGAVPALGGVPGAPVEYSVSAADRTPFAIDAEGVLTLTEVLDRDVTDAYAFEVTASSGGETVTADVSVRVTTTELVDGQSPALGEKRALWIRGQFAGEFAAQNEDEIADAMISLNKYVERESLGQLVVSEWDVTPYAETGIAADAMPSNAWEIRDIMADAAIALDPQYAPENYDYVFLSMPGGIITGGGALGSGDGTTGTAWIPVPLWTPGTVHESFHVFGVGHAEVLNGEQPYPAPPGIGGHDPYFFMGSEGSEAKAQTEGLRYDIFAAINVPMKYRMGWLREANILEVTDEGIYRVYTTRDATEAGFTVFGLRLLIGEDTIVVSYEPAVFNSSLATTGLLVHWFSGGVTRLIDNNPDSHETNPMISPQLNEVAEMSDAAVPLGDDLALGSSFNLEFVEAGGEGDARWADVRVTLL